METAEGDDNEATSGADASSHLPATCLANVLNFMEYGNVRKCLLAGKAMAVEASRHVEVLNITAASELIPAAARRFANVSEVNILCLTKDSESDEEAASFLSAPTTTRAIPFLATFPKLAAVFFGEFSQDHDDGLWKFYNYTQLNCVGPSDHGTLFRAFVEHLCGAFHTKLLSPRIKIGGLGQMYQLQCTMGRHEDCYEQPDAPCRCCRSIMKSFPLEFVLEMIPREHVYYWSALRLRLGRDAPGSRYYCISRSDAINIVSSRHADGLLFQSEAGKNFLVKLLRMATDVLVDESGDESRFATDELEDNPVFIEEMIRRGAKYYVKDESGEKYVRVMYFWKEVMEDIAKIAALITPEVVSTIPRTTLAAEVGWLRLLGEKDGKVIIRRAAFDDLVRIGFAVEPNDFVLLDSTDYDLNYSCI